MNQDWQPNYRLIFASRHGKINEVVFLLAQLAFGRANLISSISLNLNDDLKALIWSFLEVDCDVNFRDKFGSSALTLACRKGRVEVIFNFVTKPFSFPMPKKL